MKNPRTRVRDSSKYREDMMKNLDNSPGMCSDCPRITPKILDLEVFPTCLIEKERELLERMSRVGERRERDILI
jgi:hypothetical protein